MYKKEKQLAKSAKYVEFTHKTAKYVEFTIKLQNM